MTVRYRPDVDGLRAIAIVPVVLFHYGLKPFSGGFVGVDIFFVISGYLITSLIRSDIEAGRFSLANFYERRVRRIFPALFLLIAVTAIVAFVLFFPIAFKRFGQSATATSVFLSNVEFWREAGYFDLGARQKPLLHTWSLAVEEQFYLFFPPLIALSARYLNARYATVILPLLLLSLVLCVGGTYLLPSAAFFLLPTRVWELMAGALLAVAGFAKPRQPWMLEILAVLGLVAIAAAVLTFDEATPFPGIAAFLPCAGAAVLIMTGANGHSAVNRLLASPPFVLTGKISYSLYLWHWPLLVFAIYYAGRVPSPLETAALVAASVVLAVLSWRFVELPFRSRQVLGARRPLFLAAVTAMTIAAALGIVIYLFDGLPQRFDPTLQHVLAVADEHNTAECRNPVRLDSAGGLCEMGAISGGKPGFLFWGDSQARSLSPAIDAAAKRADIAGLFAVSDGCPPMLGVAYAIARKIGCDESHNEAVLASIRRYDVPTVILSARWAAYARGTRVGMEEGPPLWLKDAQSREVSQAENERVFRRGLERTVAALRDEGRRVILIGPWPEIGLPVPETLAKNRLLGQPTGFGPLRDEFLERQSQVLNEFARIAKEAAVEVVYPHETFCPGIRCSVAVDGHPLYRDDNHLSRYGAQRLQPLLERLFDAR